MIGQLGYNKIKSKMLILFFWKDNLLIEVLINHITKNKSLIKIYLILKTFTYKKCQTSYSFYYFTQIFCYAMIYN